MTASETSAIGLTKTQIRGLNKIGNVYFPGDDELPSFEECGCVEHAGAAIEFLPEDDLASLRLLLGVLGTLPALVTRGLVQIAERGPRMNGPLGVGLRFLRFGLKGIVTSLYYSGETGRNYRGKSPLDVLGYDVAVYTDDVDEREAQSPDDSHGSIAACRGLHSPS